MGLLTFAKKVKPSKAAATKNQQPATISKRLDESISIPPVLPPIEQNVLDLAVGDKGLSLDVKSEVAENSLMADILGELSGQSTGEGKWQPKDDLHSDASLVLQLTQALELDNGTTITPATKTNAEEISKPNHASLTAAASNSDRFENIFGADSIYNTRTLSTFDVKASSWLSEPKSNTNSTPPVTLEPTPAEPKRKPLVLDSDVSDSEEENESDESDDEYRDNYKVPGRPSNLKLENKYKQKTAEENQQLLSQAMIDKMKDRHRQEARVAVLRSKSVKHHQYQHQQYPLSSSSRYHSMQGLLHSNSFINSTSMAPPSFPSNYPLHNPLTMTHSVQDLSSRLDEREPIGYSLGRACPMAYPPYAPQYQSFNRPQPSLSPSPSYSEQIARLPNSPTHHSREGIYDRSRPSQAQNPHSTTKSHSIRLSHQREKSCTKDHMLKKSRSFTNDQSNRRRYMDTEYPPDSPTLEPGFTHSVCLSDSHAKSMRKPMKQFDRLSSNNSSTTDDSDTPNLPLTPSEGSEFQSQRGNSHYSDTEPVTDTKAVSTKPKWKHGIKQASSETNLRRPQRQHGISDDEDNDSEHMTAVKEDSVLKWHYRCYRQQSIYTSFSDYLAASQYQKMMFQQQQQQHIMYHPYAAPPVPPYPHNHH